MYKSAYVMYQMNRIKNNSLSKSHKNENSNNFIDIAWLKKIKNKTFSVSQTVNRPLFLLLFCCCSHTRAHYIWFAGNSFVPASSKQINNNNNNIDKESEICERNELEERIESICFI